MELEVKWKRKIAPLELSRKFLDLQLLKNHPHTKEKGRGSGSELEVGAWRSASGLRLCSPAARSASGVNATTASRQRSASDVRACASRRLPTAALDAV